MSTPPLGWIAPEDRTNEQNDAHAAALAAMPNFALPEPKLAKGDKVILTKFLEHPDVVADIGFIFNGFRQLTGSCVGVSDGDDICLLSAVQRLLSDGATKAFLPFWPFMYGRCRFLEGDRGRGEGAIDSVMGTQNGKEGVLDCSNPALPKFDTRDGLALPARTELDWSDGGSALVTAHLADAKTHLVGTRAPIYDAAGIKAAIVNGYPILDGCNNYVGNGSIRGSGADAYVAGRYDGRGGHSTAFVGVWEHPNDGTLYLYWNQWDAGTYPKDPAGGVRCSVWLPESEVNKLFRTGGGDGETMALSHLSYFPAQPKVMDDWSQLF